MIYLREGKYTHRHCLSHPTQVFSDNKTKKNLINNISEH